MSVLLDLASRLFQGGHVDELALQQEAVSLLHSVWVALNTIEYVAEHELTGGVILVAFMGTVIITKALTVIMWMVCL